MIHLHRKGRERRKLHIKRKLHGKISFPRISIFRSNKYLYAQIIDDNRNKTLIGLSDKKVKLKEKKVNKSDSARILGEILAEKAKEKKISKVVFDRNGYKYHGRIKAFADSLRSKGLEF